MIESTNGWFQYKIILNGYYIEYDLSEAKNLLGRDVYDVVFSAYLIIPDGDTSYSNASCNIGMQLTLSGGDDYGWTGQFFLPIQNVTPFSARDDNGSYLYEAIKLSVGIYSANTTNILYSDVSEIVENPLTLPLKLNYMLYNTNKYELPTNINIKDPNKVIKFDLSQILECLDIHGMDIVLNSGGFGKPETWGTGLLDSETDKYFGKISNSEGNLSNYEGIIDTTNFYYSGNNIDYDKVYIYRLRIRGFLPKFIDGVTYTYNYIINDKKTDKERNSTYNRFSHSANLVSVETIIIESALNNRPDNWEWNPLINTEAIIPFSNNTFFPVTANQWNQFWARINEFRQYKELSDFTFTVVWGESNNDGTKETSDFTCDIYNEAVEAINDIYGYEEVSEITDRNALLLANTYNSIKNALNAIT